MTRSLLPWLKLVLHQGLRNLKFSSTSTVAAIDTVPYILFQLRLVSLVNTVRASSERLGAYRAVALILAR